MALFPLFPSDESLPPQAARLGPKLRALAAQGVFFGTSSWKYEGWLGSIYTPERYFVRGKFSKKAFEADCLAEYAATFPVVGGDFSFYQFPTAGYWQRLFGGAPTDLRFGLKVPEEMTVATWPGHARYGSRAGTPNAGFLDPVLFDKLFARPLRPYRERVAVLILEFGTFSKQTFSTPAAFLERLAPFLAALPEEFRYGVEIRNREYLGTDYFRVLAEHRTAHVFNAWTRMPELSDQLALPGAFTTDMTVVRALLPKGRTYEQAVRDLEPYETIQTPQPAIRAALAQVAERARRIGQPAFLFVNNRLEGNAPSTIEAVADLLAA